MEGGNLGLTDKTLANVQELKRKCQEWIEAVTGKKFLFDFRKSLEDGVLLCELMQEISPQSIKRINRLSTAHAHLDNLNQFIKACKDDIGLKGGQLFEATDLDEPTKRRGSVLTPTTQKEADRKLRNVLANIYWLGRAASQRFDYTGPQLDLEPFKHFITNRDQVFSSVGVTISVKQSMPGTGDQSDSSTAPSPSATLQQKSLQTGVEEFTFQLESTATGSFGFQVTGGYGSKIPATIDYIVPGSPSEEKLQRGDEILSVDGHLAGDLTHTELVDLIRKAGKNRTVALVVKRKVEKASLTAGPNMKDSRGLTNGDTMSNQIIGYPDKEKAKNELRKGSGPVRVVIQQKAAASPKPTRRLVSGDSSESGGMGGIGALEQVEEEMQMVIQDLMAATSETATTKTVIENTQKEKATKGTETKITSKGKGKVTVTITKKGNHSESSSKTNGIKELVTVDPETLFETSPTARLLQEDAEIQRPKPKSPKPDDPLDTDARIKILEEELDRLKKKTNDIDDGSITTKSKELKWESRQKDPWQVIEGEHATAVNKMKTEFIHETERRQKIKSAEKAHLLTTVADSTRLPPRVASVSPPQSPLRSNQSPVVPETVQVIDISSLQYSPATTQGLEDKEAYLKEQMKQERKNISQEWKRLETERQAMEQRRKVDQSVKSVKKIEEQRQQVWQEALKQKGDEKQATSREHLTGLLEDWDKLGAELNRVLENSDLPTQNSDREDALRKLEEYRQKQRKEEKMLMANEIQRQLEEGQYRQKVAMEEQKLREMVERVRFEEERKEKLLKEETQRQKEAKRKVQKEAVWIMELEQRSRQAREKQMEEDERNRMAKEAEKQRLKETEWIRDLESRSADRSRRAMSDEGRPSSETLQLFSDLMAHADTKPPSFNPPSLRATEGATQAQYIPPSPSSVRAGYSPYDKNLPYKASMSQSFQQLSTNNDDFSYLTQGSQLRNIALVGDVHQTAPQKMSWRDPPTKLSNPPPQHPITASPKINHQQSFNQYPLKTQLCSSCSCPLGKEPSMSVGSAGLQYHMECFKCAVCHSPLARSSTSVTVLLHDSKPHCWGCYSNQAGLLTTEC